MKSERSQKIQPERSWRGTSMRSKKARTKIWHLILFQQRQSHLWGEMLMEQLCTPNSFGDLTLNQGVFSKEVHTSLVRH